MTTVYPKLSLDFIDKFNTLLSANHVEAKWVVVHPSIWNDRIEMYPLPKIIRRVFRWMGRKLNSKYLYWVGIPLHWVDGLRSICGLSDHPNHPNSFRKDVVDIL